MVAALALPKGVAMTGIHHGGTGPSHNFYCESCSKLAYVSKGLAKRAAKAHDRSLRPYRCPVNETTWHLGHLRRDILRGKATRGVYRVQRDA